MRNLRVGWVSFGFLFQIWVSFGFKKRLGCRLFPAKQGQRCCGFAPPSIKTSSSQSRSVFDPPENWPLLYLYLYWPLLYLYLYLYLSLLYLYLYLYFRYLIHPRSGLSCCTQPFSLSMQWVQYWPWLGTNPSYHIKSCFTSLWLSCTKKVCLKTCIIATTTFATIMPTTNLLKRTRTRRISSGATVWRRPDMIARWKRRAAAVAGTRHSAITTAIIAVIINVVINAIIFIITANITVTTINVVLVIIIFPAEHLENVSSAPFAIISNKLVVVRIATICNTKKLQENVCFRESQREIQREPERGPERAKESHRKNTSDSLFGSLWLFWLFLAPIWYGSRNVTNEQTDNPLHITTTLYDKWWWQGWLWGLWLMLMWPLGRLWRQGWTVCPIFLAVSPNWSWSSFLLDVIASPSTFPRACQSVSEWVSDW